jgi:hypothetical protein
MDPQIDEQVAKLLGGLKKVKAPLNFESRVLARLSTPTDEGSRLGFLKFALPAAGLAVIGLFLFLTGYLGGDVPEVDVVSSDARKADKALQESAPQTPVVSENNVQQPREFRVPETADSKPQPQVSQVPSLKDKRRPDGRGSYDIGSGDGGRMSAPGIDTNSRPGADPDMERLMRRPTILASDVLRYTGVTAEFRAGGWAVTSVAQKSVAERVGLKAGDVIVALNEIRLGKATSFPSGVDIKVVRVSRNGTVVDLKF